jgi:hypothetical protein
MPLARIITRTPEDAIAASEYLLSQGYTVETVSPGEFHITPAEIELDLDRCRPQEAVAHAKALVESQPMAVQAQSQEPVAPEPAWPQTAKIPVAYDITGRPVEFTEQEEAARCQEPDRRGRALASMHAALAEGWQSVKSLVRGLQRKRAEQRARRLEAELARDQEEIRREEELVHERVRQEMNQQREEAEPAEQHAEQEQARVAALHEAMIAAERDAARQQLPQQVDPPAPVPEVTAEVRQPPPQPSSAVAQPLLGQRKRAPGVMVRRALATAVGAGLLLLLAFVAYANRRPASPLSPAALMRDGQVKQDLPFGPATITPAPAAGVPKPSASMAAKASSAVRPATRKPSAGRRGAQQLRRPSRDDSPAEDEVVVRHSTPPRAGPQPSTAKLKRHSDMD